MIQGKTKNEAEYRLLIEDSSSSLKTFAQDRRKYYKRYVEGIKEEEEETKANTVGRLVETLLWEKDKFDEKFYLSSIAKVPTGKMLDFCNALVNLGLQGEEKTFEEMATEARKIAQFDWSLDVILKKFVGQDPEIYYREVKEIKSKDLVVVTADDIANAERIVEELKTNDFTAPIINLENSDRFEVYNQFPIEDYEIDKLPLKSLLDLLIIDHKDKTISPYDLKVVWSVEGFYSEYYLYRLAYIQAYLYREACLKLKEQRNLDYYIVNNLKFIVADSINYYKPLIYTLNSDDMDDAYNGFIHRGKNYPGVKDIIADLKWAKENNIWNISRTNYINGGIVNIKS